jgi:hypothetical protein
MAAKDYTKTRYEKRLAANLCGTCGKEPLCNWSECFDCMSKRALRRAERRYG